MTRPVSTTPFARCGAVATLLLPSVLLACSCSDETSAGAASSASAGGGAGGQGAGSPIVTGVYSSSSSSSGGGGEGASGGGPPSEPCPGYEGWETWDDYAADGDFCVPASIDALPDPIEWEPCHPSVGLPGGCQQMKITWPTDVDPIGGSVYGWVDGSSVHLSFVRNAKVGGHYHRTFIVAEADGPIRSAVMDMNGIQNPKWSLFSPAEGAMRQGKFILYIFRYNAPQGEGKQAAVGGDIGELHPKVLHTWAGLTWQNSLGAASDFWLARGLADVFVADWGGAPELVHTAGQGSGGQLASFYPFGDFLVWRDQPWPSSTLWGYKKGDSAAPLIPLDPAKNLSAFGTDGTHMVWVVSHDVKSTYDVTPFEDGARDIMVSPYTESAAGLQPQRLRSYPSVYGLVHAFAVGCGYAAHGGAESGEAILVRLSDGYSWMLPIANCTPPNTGAEVCFAEPVAVTCDEVFVRIEGAANIARISIDALGPPMPPD